MVYRHHLVGVHAGSYPLTLLLLHSGDYLFVLLTNYLIRHSTSELGSHGSPTFTTKLNMGEGTEYKAVVYFVNW